MLSLSTLFFLNLQSLLQIIRKKFGDGLINGMILSHLAEIQVIAGRFSQNAVQVNIQGKIAAAFVPEF